MSRESMQWLMECAAGCRSRKHGLELNMAVLRGSTQQAKKYLSLCTNCLNSRDKFGRTPLHAAASVGKCDLLDWIITSCKSDPNVKDLESGWSALHRAAYYGELAAVRRLLRYPKLNANSIDKEGLTAFDLLQRDLPTYVSYSTINQGDVYAWGDNVNFILGTEAVKRVPEMVEYFVKEHISVRKVLLSKFHAVFLSSCGRVFVCGHGLGGRLGTGQQRTLLSITPVPLSSSHSPITDVALGDDHTVMLTEAGVVLTCGQNVYGQLGQSNVGEEEIGRYAEPRPIKIKGAKGGEEKVTCMAAAKYHTVFGTSSGVFTCGLNAGQLGLPRGERLQPRPRLAAGPSGTHAPLFVAASVGATVVYTKAGDIFALHKYDCKKVARWPDVRQICVSGGHLDPSVHSSTGNTALTAGGGDPLVIAALTESSKDQGSKEFTISLWQANCPGGLRRIRWSGPCKVVDPLFVALSPTTLGLVTTTGEAFLASLSSMRVANQSRDQLVFGERDDVVEMNAKRVPLVHRGVHIAFDKKGKNFAVIQGSPGTCITKIPFVEESSMATDISKLLEEGELHDVVVKIGSLEVPCHKYILASGSDVFKSIFTKPEYQPPDFIHYDSSEAFELVTLDCPGLSTLVAECLMELFYRGTCRLLCPGFSVPGLPTTSTPTNRGKTSSDKKKGKKKQKETLVQAATRRSSMIDGWSGDPIRILTDLARRLNMKQFVQMLTKFHIKNNVVEMVALESIRRPQLRWNRNNESALCDAVILSVDGVRFPAHRCILAARMEYFKMMFSHSWQESCEVAPISLRLPSDVVSLILEFIYTDNIDSAIGDADNAELLCGVLAAAEVYQCRRLKDQCEELLAARLTLRNVAEILELADFYNAGQLTLVCHDFMHINAASLLDGKMLEGLPEPMMEEFTIYYKRETKAMARRVRLRADWPHPSEEHLALVDRSIDFPSLEEEDENGETPVIQLPTIQKRRRRRPQQIQQQLQQRSFSISSEDSVECPPTPQTPEDWKVEEDEFPDEEEVREEPVNGEETDKSVNKVKRAKFKTMSQKERRKLQQKEEIVVESPPQQPRKAPACPWMTSAPTAASPISLRDVMKSQEVVKAEKPRPVPSSPVKTPARPRRSSSGTGNPWGVATSPRTADTAWGVPTSPSASAGDVWGTSPPSTFAAIVVEQENLDANAARHASRPFELIQIEERALQELRTTVMEKLTPGDMNVRVEFVRGDAAPPVWKAKA